MTVHCDRHYLLCTQGTEGLALETPAGDSFGYIRYTPGDKKPWRWESVYAEMRGPARLTLEAAKYDALAEYIG